MSAPEYVARQKILASLTDWFRLQGCRVSHRWADFPVTITDDDGCDIEAFALIDLEELASHLASEGMTL